jgi:hypothetical protein
VNSVRDQRGSATQRVIYGQRGTAPRVEHSRPLTSVTGRDEVRRQLDLIEDRRGSTETRDVQTARGSRAE